MGVGEFPSNTVQYRATTATFLAKPYNTQAVDPTKSL